MTLLTILKKGRIVKIREPEFVLALSKKILQRLKPLSKKIEIAGSIRRKSKNPVDIDIVLIPKDKTKIKESLEKIGAYKQGGEKRLTFNIKGVQIEIYFAEPKTWGAMLLSYTGPFGAEIGLRVIARKKGLLLNQYGIYTRDRKYLAGKTETEIYKVLGKKYKAPELR